MLDFLSYWGGLIMGVLFAVIIIFVVVHLITLVFIDVFIKGKENTNDRRDR